MTGRRITIYPGPRIDVAEFEPEEPSRPGEILVACEASLISPGTELAGYRSRLGGPMTPGYTSVGRVLAVGPLGDEALVGQRVYLFPEQHDSHACHASHKLLRAPGLWLRVGDLDPGAACFLRMINIGLTPFRVAGHLPSGPVVIIGLGLVGLFLVQVARALGRSVIGIDPDAHRRDRAAACGAMLTIDPTAEDPVGRVRELTIDGAALTVDATGRCEMIPAAVQMTRPGGEVNTLGGVRVPHTVDLLAMLSRIQWQHVTLRGGWEMLLPRRRSAAGGPSTEDNLELALDWLRRGVIDLAPVWTQTIDPEGFADAYDALERKDPSTVGVVVRW